MGSDFKTGSPQIWILEKITTAWESKMKPVFQSVKSSESLQDFKGKTAAKISQGNW